MTAPTARHQAADDLTGRVRGICADLIDRYERRIDLTREAILDYAATRVVIDPQILAGQHAQMLVAELRRRHHPIGRWAPDSSVVKCSCGRGSCPDAELLA